MKGKKVLIILLTVLVFLSGTVLGVSSVYRVDEVVVDAKIISAEAEMEAAELKNCLQAAYEKKFTLSVKDTEANAILEDFPYFRITSIEKKYPNRLIVHVAEDDEVYAVSRAEGGYYILNREGTVLGIRDNYINRSDETKKAKNVLIEGVTVTGEKGQTIAGDDALGYLFDFCARVDELLQGIRRNIVSIEKIQAGVSADTVMLKLVTFEGVNIYVNTPSVNAGEKATAAVETYLSLEDGQRTRGMIAVADVGGVVKAVHSDKDVFEDKTSAEITQ
ncbi:MAG: hypothetical protein E7355_00040 [Clostridiales bacterium]|nr:hypothetical protein [Clostridiales bacterium]